MRPTDPASTPLSGGGDGLSSVLNWASSAFCAIGLGALCVVTLVSPGATRMYAWPWSLAYAVALIAPAVRILIRLASRNFPFALPSAAWVAATLGATVVVLASALASPYRGTSLLWSAPLLSGLGFFFAVFDWLHCKPDETTARQQRLLTVTGFIFGAIALTSMVLWASRLPSLTPGTVFAARNPFPLGHSNYAAGLPLLILPAFFALAVRVSGRMATLACIVLLLALAMLLTSGSRGGFLGLAALLILNLRAITQTLRLKLWVVVTCGVAGLAAFLVANPRTRAAIGSEELSASNIQRSAMLAAGWRMGADRPLLGWGPGVTPLAYPRYRAGLAGGTENVLQLHSTPVQIWAELGAVGLLSAGALLALAFREARKSAVARNVLFAVSGYAVFSLTDWQLDVPIFVAALAAAAALVASPAPLLTPEPKTYTLPRPGGGVFSVRVHEDLPALRRLLGLTTLLALVGVEALGHRDPTPELNIRALALAREPAGIDEAIALLRRSLALNPDQEIAHFNLGWLLVVRDPADAEQHLSAAARLVPDKGGVYLGLGLAQLNQRHRDAAERSLAFECLNDPAFLVSPWWRMDGIAELRTNTLVRLVQFETLAIAALPAGKPLGKQAQYVRELSLWVATGAPVSHPDTSARTAYFASKPAPPAFEKAPAVVYHRERTGYPVLMRNLDLPVPTDLFDVQDNSLATGEFGFLFPVKGWLASPLLPALLAASDSPKK